MHPDWKNIVLREIARGYQTYPSAVETCAIGVINFMEEYWKMYVLSIGWNAFIGSLIISSSRRFNVNHL